MSLLDYIQDILKSETYLFSEMWSIIYILLFMYCNIIACNITIHQYPAHMGIDKNRTR